MSRPQKLDEQALAAALAALPEWSLREGKLHREFAFVDFATAFGFMAQAVSTIEKLDHHPEWFNVYGRVVVDLVTHDAGGITELDLRLARTLETIARRLS
jgi:4a-hydroxytetrahydrobiopterin dehydratase